MDSKKNNTDPKSDNLYIKLRSIGVLFPTNSEELSEFDAIHSEYSYTLNEYITNSSKLFDEVENEEKDLESKINITQTKPIRNLYFKRAVLAAEITAQLYDEPTFGHVKLQKLIYLCEHAANYDLSHKYVKEAAGPYDRKFMHTIDYEFRKQRWFDVKKEKDGYKYTYKPLENLDKYKVYYEKYFSTFNERIQWLISTFRSQKTDIVEIVATLYACSLEIVSRDEPLDENYIIEIFYKWSESKKRFEKKKLLTTLKWMKSVRLYPSVES
ncbi:MAG: hypothetical protein HYV28_05855 [Ignavibacteriales bacterium]|nr:hypothetical protein [Ignavibacteriales bacterium]